MSEIPCLTCHTAIDYGRNSAESMTRNAGKCVVVAACTRKCGGNEILEKKEEEEKVMKLLQAENFQTSRQ